MRYKWDKKYLYWAITAFLVVAACLLLYALISNITSVSEFFVQTSEAMAPVVVGFVFAYLLTPVMNFFEKRWYRPLFTAMNKASDTRKAKKEPGFQPTDNGVKIRGLSRGMGVFTAMLSAVVFLLALIWAVIPQLILSIETIFAINFRADVLPWIEELGEQYPDFYNAALNIVNEFDVSFSNLSQLVTTHVMPRLSDIWDGVSGGIFQTFRFVFNFVIGIVICAYLLNSKELFAAQFKKALYSIFKVRTANTIIENIRLVHKKFGGFLTGKIIESVIIGFVFFVIFSVIGMPYTILISVVLGVTNVIPVFGPIIGAIPTGLLVLIDNPINALWFVIVVVVVQQIDGNIIGPRILGENTGISSFWVLFALLLGQHLFGFAGLLIGIPIFAVIYSLFREYVVKRLKFKELPVDSNYYRELGYFDTDSGEAVSLKTIREKEAVARAAAEREKLSKRKPTVISKRIGELRSKNKKIKK
ncbi:MAG: AI-2E family transporter [Oscillospiraceae bacterium]|nr:AI-2E family transporter [Oscillospiraceae bacterium]